MSFLSNVIGEFTHQGGSSQGGGYGGAGGYNERPYEQGGYASGPPPQVPPPWRAVCTRLAPLTDTPLIHSLSNFANQNSKGDEPARRWLFVNEATGTRTFEFPSTRGYDRGYAQGEYQGYNQGQYQGYGQGYQQGEYAEERREEQQRHGGGHGLAYGAVGAAAGLAGGALLMHEGEEIKDDWERDKWRAEERVDDAAYDVEEAPEEVAGWAGRKVSWLCYRKKGLW